MTLTLSDRTQAITTTIGIEEALDLLAALPRDITVRVRPDGFIREPHPGGYFGLAVALAHKTWYEDCPTCGQGSIDAEYAAYLRGERQDPRD